jgi:hypothetical protein
MGLLLPQNDSQFELPPSGMHVAICYRLIDLGTQNFPYQGQPNIGRFILISWELPNERLSDGRPFTIGRRWKYSGNEKARMRLDLEAWRGVKFTEGDFGRYDITKVVGQPAMLNIVHDSKDGTDYANIAGIGPLVKGTKAPQRVNDIQLLVLEKGEFNKAVFDKLSEKLKEQISHSPEYLELHTPRNGHAEKLAAARAEISGSGEHDLNDEIPF